MGQRYCSQESRASRRHNAMDTDMEEKDRKDQEYHTMDEVLSTDLNTDEKFYHKMVWPNVIFFAVLHICALWGVYHTLFHAKLFTILWGCGIGFWSGEAVTLGAHRYYSHKSYKATAPLRVAMLILQTMAGQNSMRTWARDHRLHHKYSDTDADPHNATRGFFFSHMGWLMSRKHPLVIEKGRAVDVNDLNAEKLLMFQHRYYIPLYLFFGLAVPICIPVYGWGETFSTAFFVPYCLRYVVILHLTWTINSVAHMFGYKPYDERIVAVESKLTSVLTGGEGWHNYHHSFPWDYRTGEFGIHNGMNTRILHKLFDCGLAYEFRMASANVVQGHKRRHGDSTHATNAEGRKVQEYGLQDGCAVKDVKNN